MRLLLPPPGERALPVLAGAILALSFPPVRLLLPVFFGLVPLLYFIDDRPPGPVGRWAATRAGLVTGVVFFGVQLYWLAVALLPTSVLAIPAYAGVVLVLAGLVGAFAWAVHYTRERIGLPLAVAAAVFWTLLEWVQGHLGPLAFPWLGLAAGLTPFPTLAGAADVVGARGLTLWIAAINGLVASALLLHRERRSMVPTLLLVLAVFAGPAGYGVLRTETLRMRPVAAVAAVQPDITDDVKRGPGAVDSSLTAVARLTQSVADVPLQLVAWPEVALPAPFSGAGPLADSVRALSGLLRAPILVGAYGVGPGGEVHNSAFLVRDTSADGEIARYDKRRLVPFIERRPFRRPIVREDAADAAGTEAFRRFGALSRGRDAPILETATGGAFGVLICYESIFPELARRYRADGAEFLVNITNDAWYGHDTWWGRTTGLWQHPAHLVLRAIETRTGVARAANTGFSLFVDPLGRVYRRTALFEPTVALGIVYTVDEVPPFVRWGDWVGTMVVVFGVLLLLAAAAWKPPPTRPAREGRRAGPFAG